MFEAPPNSSPAIGSATFTLSGNLFTINTSFSGLQGTTTAAHVHCCVAPPGTAGVATQGPTFIGFPVGVFAGTYVTTFDLTLASSYNPAFITANSNSVVAAQAAFVAGLNSGTSYLNLHTTAFPPGEIRGFITVVPEPGTVLLAASGLFAVALFGRRRHG